VPTNWLSIRVDLVEGRGISLWPRPGRIFAAARTNTFAQFATSIDDAFARWDRAHLHQFWLADGHRVGEPDDDDFDPDSLLDDRRTKLGQLRAGEQFVYEFDFGDSWLHLCTVGPQRISPEEMLGIVPPRPLPYWGWGAIPDQYGREWDDGSEAPGPDPKGADLPPIGPWERPGHGAPPGT
jgi:hypothetical protein